MFVLRNPLYMTPQVWVDLQGFTGFLGGFVAVRVSRPELVTGSKCSDAAGGNAPRQSQSVAAMMVFWVRRGLDAVCAAAYCLGTVKKEAG